MKSLPFFAAILCLSAMPAFAASVQVAINDQPYTGSSNPKGVKLVAGQPFTVEIKVTGGKVSDPPWLKHNGDVQMNGANTDAKPDSDSYSFYLTPTHAGPLTFPAIDIPMVAGPALHIDPIKLVVYGQ